MKYSTLVVAFVLSLFLKVQPCGAQYLGWDKQEHARTHNTDLQHIELHISFDQMGKKVIGNVLTTLAVLPQKDPVTEIVLDEQNLNISSVTLNPAGRSTSLSFDTTEAGKVRIKLPAPAEFNKPFTIGVQYTTQNPKKGIYFRGPDTVNTDRPYQIWTQGEGEDNHYWFPTYDYPNDKTTSEMFVTVNADQQALSNGRLVGKKKNRDGTVTWNWTIEHPHSTYLIMLGIGKYSIVEDKWHGKPVEYWVYPGWENDAHRIFGLTPDMIDFFSRKTGVDYPWEKYAQIAIAEFQYGGMENTTATTLNDYVLFDKKTAVHFSSESLIAHELAHQWFGDYVTCRGWINMWLNESFATYFEALYREYHDGKAEFDEELQGNQNASLAAEAQLGKKPIVAANNYTANIYPRGSTVLNMMRHILGDEGWWKTIHHYLDVHQFNNVEANDLKVAAEEATGQNLDWFFDQWIYKSGHPIYDVTYNYEPTNHLVRMQVVQTQERDSMTSTFKMPIDVELTMADGSRHLETVRNFDSSQTFTFAANQKPLNVIFDKGNTILKELHIQKSQEEWVYQLQHSTDAIERSEAAEALGSRSYAGIPTVMNALAHTATSDSFWAPRMYALTSLAAVSDSLKTYERLVANSAAHDVNPDVRQAAVGLSTHMSDRTTARQIAMGALQDSSYRINGLGVRALYRLDPGAGTTAAIASLSQKSPRDNVRYAAVDVLSESKSEADLDRLIAMIGERNLPKYSRWHIIDAIGDNATVDSAKVYTVLWNLTHNGDRDIRVTALNNLANHGGPATLQTLEAARPEHPDMKDFFDELEKRMQTRFAKKQQGN